MKRQWLAIVAVCLVVMTFLTVFLMNRYRTKTEKVFAELMEESLLSSHSEAVTEIEGYLNESEDQEDIEAAWEKLDKDESNIFHYICNSEGEILAGDMIIFDIKYTVATELRSVHVKDKKSRK